MQGNVARTIDKALRNPHSLTPLILVMGFIGASLRYLLEMALPADGGFPAATLIVNIFGCFTLEIINQHVARRTKLPSPLVKSMGIGLIGAFTTIAALSTENLTFLLNGEYGLFALYATITIASTFLAAYGGKLVADRLEGTVSATKEKAAARKVPTGKQAATETAKADRRSEAAAEKTPANNNAEAKAAAIADAQDETTVTKETRTQEAMGDRNSDDGKGVRR